jgi:hypothetical protein
MRGRKRWSTSMPLSPWMYWKQSSMKPCKRGGVGGGVGMHGLQWQQQLQLAGAAPLPLLCA